MELIGSSDVAFVILSGRNAADRRQFCLLHDRWFVFDWQPSPADHAPGAPRYEGQLLNPAEYQPQVQQMHQLPPQHLSQVLLLVNVKSEIVNVARIAELLRNPQRRSGVTEPC